jgi:endonuclease-3
LLQALKAEYPRAECALVHHDPLQLLIATILSAQCTDVRVNQVTPELFLQYPTAEALAKAPLPSLENLIRSTGFFRNKARNIKASCEILVTKYGGKVPVSMDHLLGLPGVARKTANVVLGTAYGIASGVVVDTHVFRLSHRLGLTRSKTPEKVEGDLVRILPQDEWINFSHLLIHHGRRVCTARSPECLTCTLSAVCPRVGVSKKTARLSSTKKPAGRGKKMS